MIAISDKNEVMVADEGSVYINEGDKFVDYGHLNDSSTFYDINVVDVTGDGWILSVDNVVIIYEFSIYINKYYVKQSINYYDGFASDGAITDDHMWMVF